MTIKTSGTLAVSEIASEYGGTAPHSLSEYYSGGLYVPAGTRDVNGATIPSSGTIRSGNFFGSKKWIRSYQTAGDGTGFGSGSGLVYGAHTTSGGNAGMPGNTPVQNYDSSSNLWYVDCSGNNWFPLIITLANNYRLGSSDQGYNTSNVPIFMWRNQYSQWTDAMITNELGMNANQISRSYRASQVWWEASYAGMDNQLRWGLAILDSRNYSAGSPGNTWANKSVISYWYANDYGGEWQGHGFYTNPSITGNLNQGGYVTIPQNFTRTGDTSRDSGGYLSSLSDYSATLNDYSLVIPVLASDNGFSGGAYNGARNPLTARFGFVNLA
jgi:hypothetical protein